MNVIEARGLARRFRRTWALRDCTLAIPSGRVAAVVGPNGAGKTTLFHLAAGLLGPTSGAITVLGGTAPGSAAARAGIGFLAQDAPLYGHLPAADMLRLAGSLNRTWDAARARGRLADLGIPPGRKVRQLSAGQRAQLALAIALAKRPQALILDEPLASLDPLARHDLAAALMAAVAQDGVSVVFSTHIVAELERLADYLIVLHDGRVQVAGGVDDLLAGHRVLSGPAGEHRLARAAPAADPAPPGWQAAPAGLEEILLAYLRDPAASALPGPRAARARQREGSSR